MAEPTPHPATAAHLSDLATQIAAAEARLQRLQAEIEEKDTEISNKTKVLAQLDQDIQQVLGIRGRSDKGDKEVGGREVDMQDEDESEEESGEESAEESAEET
ncbi:hypothetical protein EDC01DRAFT_780274 [Geopyxis carbonaria]|nr:hypothetical protein EDC01DRAFT_780274 [Geopyxis carbonaria]